MNRCKVCKVEIESKSTTGKAKSFCCTKHRTFYINHKSFDADSFHSEALKCEDESDWRKFALKWYTDSKSRYSAKLFNPLFQTMFDLTETTNTVLLFISRHNEGYDLSDKHQFTTWINDSKPKPCPQCGSDPAFDNNKGVWRTYCSSNCAQSSMCGGGAVRAKMQKTLMSRYGNLSGHTCEKSERSKATKMLKYGNPNYNGPHDNRGKHNKNISADMILSDFDQIYSMYNTQGMSCKSIGAVVGCSEGHVKTWLDKHNIQTRSSKSDSSYEVWLRSIIGDIDGVEFNARPDWLGGKELDIFCNRTNTAIEINGLYWHSDKFKSRSYHRKKKDVCRDNGVNLIHLYEHDIIESPDKVASIVMNALGRSRRIYARNLSVGLATKEEARDFMNINHIQGHTSSSIHVGLYDGSELIQLATFGRPRFNTTCTWELIRLCSKLNTVVVGGASKIMKSFTSAYSGDILSYAQYDRSLGNVYDKMGFEFIGVSDPSYIYFKPAGFKVLSRHQCMKHKLPKLLGDKFDPDLSERDNMKANGWVRVYDCGNLKYVLKN